MRVSYRNPTPLVVRLVQMVNEDESPDTEPVLTLTVDPHVFHLIRERYLKMS